MTGADAEPVALEQLGHDVERLVVAVCGAGSSVLGLLGLLAAFVLALLVAADVGLLNRSPLGAAEPGVSGVESGTGTSPGERIVPGRIDGIPPVPPVAV